MLKRKALAQKHRRKNIRNEGKANDIMNELLRKYGMTVVNAVFPQVCTMSPKEIENFIQRTEFQNDLELQKYPWHSPFYNIPVMSSSQSLRFVNGVYLLKNAFDDFIQCNSQQSVGSLQLVGSNGGIAGESNVARVNVGGGETIIL